MASYLDPTHTLGYRAVSSQHCSHPFPARINMSGNHSPPEIDKFQQIWLKCYVSNDCKTQNKLSALTCKSVVFKGEGCALYPKVADQLRCRGVSNHKVVYVDCWDS